MDKPKYNGGLAEEMLRSDMNFDETTNSSYDEKISKKTNESNELIVQERATFLNTWLYKGRMINVLIDTGADECLIRKDLILDKSRIEPSPNTTAKLFNGSEVNLLGYINESVTYEGVKLEMPFYVVEELSNGMILGSNWVRMSGVILTQEIRVPYLQS